MKAYDQELIMSVSGSVMHPRSRSWLSTSNPAADGEAKGGLMLWGHKRNQQPWLLAKCGGLPAKCGTKNTCILKTVCKFNNHSSLILSLDFLDVSIFLKFLDVIHTHSYYLAFFAEILTRCLWNCQEAHSKSQETNAHVLFAGSLQWKSQTPSPMSRWSTPLSSRRITEFDIFLGRGNESKKRHKNHWCMMAPFLGGLVDWPLRTSAINAIQLSNKCQPFQLRTNWWCSLATFAQFLSHEQQHFQNLPFKLWLLHFLQKSQTRYVTTLPLCYKSTNLEICCIFSLRITLFVQAAFEWPQQFWSSEVHQIRHGKIDSEAPFNTISMTEIPLFLTWPVLGHVKTGCELASVFLMFGRCWLHCEALVTENIPWDPSVHLSEDSYSYVVGDC